MRRRFQILIEGVVRSDPDSEITGAARLEEMKRVVETSFKPDLQWGVTYNTYEVLILEGVSNRTPQ